MQVLYLRSDYWHCKLSSSSQITIELKRPNFPFGAKHNSFGQEWLHYWIFFSFTSSAGIPCSLRGLRDDGKAARPNFLWTGSSSGGLKGCLKISWDFGRELGCLCKSHNAFVLSTGAISRNPFPSVPVSILGSAVSLATLSSHCCLFARTSSLQFCFDFRFVWFSPR